MIYKTDTLRKLSKEIGVSTSTLSRLSNGKEGKITSILSVCAFLKRPITDFIKNSLDRNELPVIEDTRPDCRCRSGEAWSTCLINCKRS